MRAKSILQFRSRTKHTGLSRDHLVWLLDEKQGFKESSIRSAIAALKAVARKVDIFDVEAVKSYLANAKVTEGRKERIVNDLTRFYKYKNIRFEKPRYTRVDILPFIAHEREIDELIAKLGKKTATFVRVLKETGMRPGEAWDS